MTVPEAAKEEQHEDLMVMGLEQPVVSPKAPFTPGTAGHHPPSDTVTLLVSCHGEKNALIAATLVGEYHQMGFNHGRRFFMRKREDSNPNVVVFLYFWDGRDGPNYTGWWFGDRVGGAHVWSRCEKNDELPPATGWRLPWNGPVQPSLVVEVKEAAKKRKAKEEVIDVKAKEELEEEAQEPVKEELKDLSEVKKELQNEKDVFVQNATDQVILAEIEASQALISVHSLMEGKVDEEAFKAAEELLVAQKTALADAHLMLGADIKLAKKESSKSVPKMRKLTPRLRAVEISITKELATARQMYREKKAEELRAAGEERKRAAAEERLQQDEQRDAKALEEMLPLAIDAVTGVEDLLEEVETNATPIPDMFFEEMNEGILTAIGETEVSATKAQSALKAARELVLEKTMLAQKYAPEAQKVALGEYSLLQEKLNEAQRTLAPYLRVRQEYEQKLEARRLLVEVAGKLGAVEVEVGQVLHVLASTQPSEGDIEEAEESLAPAIESLQSAMEFVDERMKTAPAALREDLAQMRERGQESKMKLDACRERVREESSRLQVKTVLQEGLEQAQQAETALKQVASVDLPSVKAVQELPADQATAAIQQLEGAAHAADMAASQAISFLKGRLSNVGLFPEEERSSAVEELSQLQCRVEVVVLKMSEFKRKTESRVSSLLLRDVVEQVARAEKQVAVTAKAATPLSADKISEAGTEEFKKYSKAALEAEKSAAMACVEARKMLTKKQCDKQTKASPSCAVELARLQTRLGTAQAELAQQRRFIMIFERSREMSQVEAEIDRIEVLATPLGDESSLDERFHDTSKAMKAVQKLLDGVEKQLEQVLHDAQGSMKACLDDFFARIKRSKARLIQVGEITKEQGERIECRKLLQEARAKVDKVDEAILKIGEAHLLPVMHMDLGVTYLQVALGNMENALTEARGVVAEKIHEVQAFIKMVAKEGTQELGALSKMLDDAARRLPEVKVEAETRHRAALLQALTDKVAGAEEAVQKRVLAIAPLAMHNVEEISPEFGQEICSKLGEADRVAQMKLDEAHGFVAKLQRTQKGHITFVELPDFMGRLKTAKLTLSEARAPGSDIEQQFVAKVALQEAADLLKACEENLAKANDTALPMVSEGGRSFAAEATIRTVLDLLKEHGKLHGLKIEDAFEKITVAPGSDTVAQEAFVSFLEKIPDVVKRPDLALTHEQRLSVFRQADKDMDGLINKSEFLELFRNSYVCVEQVPITDGININSKVLGTVGEKDIVDAMQDPEDASKNGVTRMRVEVQKDGKEGWVTLKGKDGTTYFDPANSFASLTREVETGTRAAEQSLGQVSHFMKLKSDELKGCETGPLGDAMQQLIQMRPKVSMLKNDLDQLKRRVDEGKREHRRKEENAKRRREEAHERRACNFVVDSIAEKVKNAQECMRRLEETVKPLVSAGDGSLASVADPTAAQKTAQELADALRVSIREAREEMKVYRDKIGNREGVWGEVVRDITKQSQKVSVMDRKAKELKANLQSASENTAEFLVGQVSSAVRSFIQSQGTTMSALFTKLADEKTADISQSAFCEFLQTLPGLAMTQEQQQFLVQQTDPRGTLSRNNFLNMLERYTQCVKDVLITGEFSIHSSAGTLRRLEVGEMVEVLEGPQRDDKTGLTRVRARALSDGKQGWITSKGNQGTVFLQECPKPFLVTHKPIVLQDTFASEGAKDVRELMPAEVLEVVEGPRTEDQGSIIRARGRACADGLEGWLTIKNKKNKVFAEAQKNCYRCIVSVAITDSSDIKECKVLRKLDQDEVLYGLGERAEDESTGVARLKMKTVQDGITGWVTIQGNAGSVYIKEHESQYVVLSPTALESGKHSESSTSIRTLEVNESVELLQAPHEEKSRPSVRVYGRAVTDGQVGWATFKDGNLRPWSTEYRCLRPVDMTRESNLTEVVRRLEPGEIVDLLEGPRAAGSSRSLELRGRATKDGAIGWVSIVREGSDPYLETVCP